MPPGTACSPAAFHRLRKVARCAPNAPWTAPTTTSSSSHGSAGARFGRNFPLSDVKPDVAHMMMPNPRDVLFQPVPFLNLLAGSGIEFQTHDWFAHGRDDSPENPRFDPPLTADDPWPQHPINVRTRPPARRHQATLLHQSRHPLVGWLASPHFLWAPVPVGLPVGRRPPS